MTSLENGDGIGADQHRVAAGEQQPGDHCEHDEQGERHGHIDRHAAAPNDSRHRQD